MRKRIARAASAPASVRNSSCRLLSIWMGIMKKAACTEASSPSRTAPTSGTPWLEGLHLALDELEVLVPHRGGADGREEGGLVDGYLVAHELQELARAVEVVLEDEVLEPGDHHDGPLGLLQEVLYLVVELAQLHGLDRVLLLRVA